MVFIDKEVRSQLDENLRSKDEHERQRVAKLLEEGESFRAPENLHRIAQEIGELARRKFLSTGRPVDFLRYHDRGITEGVEYDQVPCEMALLSILREYEPSTSSVDLHHDMGYEGDSDWARNYVNQSSILISFDPPIQ